MQTEETTTDSLDAAAEAGTVASDASTLDADLEELEGHEMAFKARAEQLEREAESITDPNKRADHQKRAMDLRVAASHCLASRLQTNAMCLMVQALALNSQ